MTGSELSLALDYPPGEASHSLIAGFGQPTSITCESQTLNSITELETASSGWTWLPGHGLLAVKAPHTAGGTVRLRIMR